MSESRGDASSAGCCGDGAPVSEHRGPVSGMLAGTPTYMVAPVAGVEMHGARESAAPVREGCCGPVSGTLAGARMYIVAPIGGPLPVDTLDRERVGANAPSGWCSWLSDIAPSASGPLVAQPPVFPAPPTAASVRVVVSPLPGEPKLLAPSPPPKPRITPTHPIPFVEGATHVPKYPRRDVNRPQRTRPETVILIKAHYETAAVEWPPTNAAASLFTAASQLARANGAKGYVSEFDMLFIPASGTEPFFEVTLSGSPPSAFLHKHMLDLIIAIESKYRIALTTFDHAVVILPAAATPNLRQALNIGRYAVLTADFGSNLPSPEDFAPGMMHELGHGYGLAHANLYREWQGGALVGYGDIFDWMGEVSYTGWRYSLACRPPGMEMRLAASTDVHLNPIHKWQFGWLDDTSILRVQPGQVLSNVRIDSIATADPSDRVVALQIERNLDTSTRIPISLLAYYRGNEPQVRDGVSLAFVSREQIAENSKLIERSPGPITGPGCLRPAGTDPIPFPGWNVTLGVGEDWTDQGGSGVRIKCEFVDPERNYVLVSVDNSAQPVRPFQNIPILDVICPLIESGKVLGNNDVITVQVDASNPDGNPERVAWKDIDYVEARLQVGEEPNPNILQFGPSGPQAIKRFLTGKEIWQFATRDLFDPAPMGQGEIRKLVLLKVTAKTVFGTEIIGGRRFLLDQSQ